MQEKKLVDLYLSSNLNVEAINHKNDVIKKEIDKLTKQKDSIDPDDEYKEYSVELLKMLDCTRENDEIIFKNNLAFSCIWDSLNRRGKKILISRLISSIEISRDKNYNINIESIKFTDEFINRCSKGYIEYLNEILTDNEIGVTYKEQIGPNKLKELMEDYHVFSLQKLEHNEYTKEEINYYNELIQEHFYFDGIIYCPYNDGKNIVDNLVLIPKIELYNL